MIQKTQNEEKFYQVLQSFDLPLYMIKVALEETHVNPLILLDVIRTIGNLSIGSGWGKIQIFMQARIITQIKPEESVEVNKKAVVDNKTKIV